MFPRNRFLFALAAALFVAMISSMAANATGSVHHNTTGGTTTNTNVNTAVAGAHANASSQSGAKSDASAVSQDGDVTTTSLSLALSGCQQGAGASGMGFGATLGAESRVCQLLRLAVAHQALGQPFEAMRLVRQATAEMNGGGYTPEEAPVLARVSRFLRRQVVAPLFGWLPFVGHAV